MAKSVIEVLTEARELVEHGWCQGAYAFSEEGRKVGIDDAGLAAKVCLTCAVTFASRRTNVSPTYLYELMGLDDGFYGAVRWNDAPGRTQAEVVLLFDRAIEREQEKAKATP